MATRTVMIVFGDRIPLPERVQHALRFAPACALTALIAPELLTEQGAWAISLANAKLIGGAMVARGRGGRVINIASINALVSNRGIAGRHYETAKAAVLQFTRALAADWAPHGVTVNAILPGGFLTDTNRRWMREAPEVIETFKRQIPMGELGDPEDLGPLAVYLASDASRYMTGAALVIDNTKHIRKVLHVDPGAQVAVVEPGLVLDHLNADLKKHGLWYPVDVSTSAQATLGGMAGNNSCGSRSNGTRISCRAIVVLQFAQKSRIVQKIGYSERAGSGTLYTY